MDITSCLLIINSCEFGTFNKISFGIMLKYSFPKNITGAAIKGILLTITNFPHLNCGLNKDFIQIPFDMRSVIPAICGHSFFKYFYGCKVNVLNRYLGRQTVFFC